MASLTVQDAAHRLDVNPDRLQSLAKATWPVAEEDIGNWEANPPEWLAEIRRREAAKAAGPTGHAPKQRNKSSQRRKERDRGARQRRMRWMTLECPAGHSFAVKGVGTEDSFAEDSFYAFKDPTAWCGRCSGEALYSAGDLEAFGLSKYRIGKLPEPDYYEPNPVDERFAPARLWTASTLQAAGVELAGKENAVSAGEKTPESTTPP